MRLRLLLRLIDIQRILVRHGLDDFIKSAHLFRPVRILFLLSPFAWLSRKTSKPRGVRIREALEELGPIYVKFGQSVSTRQDLLPPDIGQELAKLQDQVPPFPAEAPRGTDTRSINRRSPSVRGSLPARGCFRERRAS